MTITTPSVSTQTTDETPSDPGILERIKQSREDVKLLAWANEQYSRAKMDRTYHERQWYINMCFFAGKHYIEMLATVSGTNSFMLRTPSAPPWRVRMIANKIRPIARHEMARLTSQKPTFTVVPASTEDEDYAAARAGEAIFTAIYEDKNVAKEVRRAVWWDVIVGTGFLKSYWDPTAVDVQSKQMGDIKIERVSPFAVYVPDLAEEELENQPWVLHASTKSPDWCENNFGFRPAANVTVGRDTMEESFLRTVGVAQLKPNSVLILEFWMKPGAHKQFPKGGLFHVVGDKLFRSATEYPYAHGEFPFYKFDGIPTGKFYADSVLIDLIPLQREYNRTKSQIIEAKNIMAKPRLIAPRGSVNPRQITTEPGQVILYQPGLTPPQPLPMDSLPPFVLQELDRLQSDMDDISAQHEITRGNTPAQVTAATAISFLQEQDDSKLSYQVSSVEEALQKLGRHVLKYVTQFWQTPRIVRTVGRDGAFEAQALQAGDLNGNTDVRVEAGSALPRSKAARQAFVMDLLKLGVLPPEQALELLDIGGIDKIYEDFMADKRQSQRENLKMAGVDPAQLQQLLEPQVDPMTGQPAPPPVDPTTGQPMTPQQMLLQMVPVNSWDNHQAHVQFHNQFRKSQQFEMLDDSVKTLFEQHVMMHMYTLQQQAQPTLPGGNPGPQVALPGTMAEQQQQQAAQQPPQQPQPQQGA